jgi:hypothetical protein
VSIGSFKLAMYSGYKLHVVTFGTKRRRRNVGKLNNELNIVNQLLHLQGEFKPPSSDSADRGCSIIQVTIKGENFMKIG